MADTLNLLPGYEVVSADKKMGAVAFNCDGKLILIDTSANSQMAQSLRSAYFREAGIDLSRRNDKIFANNIETLEEAGFDFTNVMEDVADFEMATVE